MIWPNISTRLGTQISLALAGTSYLSGLVGQSTDTVPPVVTQAVGSMSWPTALASIVASVGTIVTILSRVRDNTKRLDEMTAELAATKIETSNAKLETDKAKADLVKANETHRQTRLQLKKIQKGLNSTRKHRHDERDAMAGTIIELRGKIADIAEGVNKNSPGLRKVLDQAGHSDIPTAEHIDPWMPKAKTEPKP